MSSAISIRPIAANETLSDLVEQMTGWSAYELWRCQHVSDNVQCTAMATIDLGNPAKVSCCEACSRLPAYKRFKVREQLFHSEDLKRDFKACRHRHLALVPTTTAERSG